MQDALRQDHLPYIGKLNLGFSSRIAKSLLIDRKGPQMEELKSLRLDLRFEEIILLQLLEAKLGWCG